MKEKYQFHYVETQEVLTDFLKVNGMTKLSNNNRIVVAMGGVFVLVIMLYTGVVPEGNPAGVFMFGIKYLIGWALAFVIAEILARTVGRRIELITCNGDGEDLYSRRIEKWKKPSEVKVEFGKDSWTSKVHGIDQTLYYKDVIRIIESDEILAMIAQVATGGKKFFGFPKNGLQDGDIEEFKAFLLSKCTGVKKGIEKVNIRDEKADKKANVKKLNKKRSKKK